MFAGKLLLHAIAIIFCFATLGHSLSDDVYIIQISTDVTIEDFFNVYPFLVYKASGKVHIGHFQAIYGSFDSSLIRYLSYSSLVLDISKDISLTIFEVQTNAPRHLARISQKERLGPWGPYDYVYDPSAGSGIDVYVVDTGVNSNCSEFSNRALNLVDFTGEGLGDNNGHGTCVAGIIGSSTYGVAKNVTIWDIKTLGSDGKGNLIWTLLGLEYILEHHKSRGNSHSASNSSVINMSFGAPKNSIFNRAAEQMISAGFAVIAAAGNSDTSACRVSPASADGVISVGAFDDRSDSIASFSNWGLCVDLFAPGVNVASVDFNQNLAEMVYSGTSVSSSICSGLVAYYIGMGYTSLNAMQKVIDLRVKGALSKSTLIFKPWTDNAIIYNDAGEPVW